jgi:hypothetical protein
MNITAAQFAAFLCGGLPTAMSETINVLALLFERIYIPFNPTVLRRFIDCVKQFKGTKKIETLFFYAELERGELTFKENSPLSFDTIQNLTDYIGKASGKSEEGGVNLLFHKAIVTTALVLNFYEQALDYTP